MLDQNLFREIAKTSDKTLISQFQLASDVSLQLCLTALTHLVFFYSAPTTFFETSTVTKRTPLTSLALSMR